MVIGYTPRACFGGRTRKGDNHHSPARVIHTIASLCGVIVEQLRGLSMPE